MKNILIVSRDYEKNMANAMWRLNTNYTVIKCTDLTDPGFLKYIKDNPSIIITKDINFKDDTPLKMQKFLKKYNIRLVVIASDTGDEIVDSIGNYMVTLHDDIQIITEKILGREDTNDCLAQIMNND